MQEKEYKTLIKDIQNLLDNVCDDDRVKYHINPVVEIACKMAKEMNADIQVVEIAAYFHDITKMTGERKNHHLTGAKYAEDFLSNYNIEKSKVEQIKSCIKKHRGSSEFTRDTIEEKIIATADAVAHIEHPLTLFYAWYGRRQCQIDEGADGIIHKLERSWNKIEFPEVKNELQGEYNILMRILKER
jgi:putative nucleotidyltransferase with HDIG domain